MHIPITINGHCRNLRQSVLFALLLSHIPPPKIGIESKNVKKFTRPIKWLLVLIFFFFYYFGIFFNLCFFCWNWREQLWWKYVLAVDGGGLWRVYCIYYDSMWGLIRVRLAKRLVLAVHIILFKLAHMTIMPLYVWKMKTYFGPFGTFWLLWSSDLFVAYNGTKIMVWGPNYFGQFFIWATGRMRDHLWEIDEKSMPEV